MKQIIINLLFALPLVSYGQLQVSETENIKPLAEYKSAGKRIADVTLHLYNDGKDSLYMITFKNGLYIYNDDYRSFSFKNVNDYREFMSLLSGLINEKNKDKETNVNAASDKLSIRWIGNEFTVIVQPEHGRGSTFIVNKKIIEKLNVL